MRIRLGKALVEEINDGKLNRFGIDVDDLRYGKNHLWIDVEEMTDDHAKELHGMLSKAKAFGHKAASGEMKLYLDTLEEMRKASGTENGFADIRINKVEHFATYVRRLYKPMKLHRVYKRDAGRGVMFCYYLYDVRYIPATKQGRDDYTIPEHVRITLAWKEFGEERKETYSFDYDDVVRLNVKEVFRRANLYLPDPSQDKHYEETVVRFNSIMSNVGEQYLASGNGTDDVDSNNDRGSYWWRSSNIMLDKGGEPSNVVVDVFKETDEDNSRSSRRNSGEADMSWWKRLGLGDEEYVEEVDNNEPEVLPIHPNLVIFALRKQVRLRVHIDQLVKYEYDVALGEKLVLPEESINLVKTLVSWKGGFQDIIKNKGGGAVVLSVGIPGTGKTLTAEVYAEVMEKPLYTVQCSQLGTNPDDLEKELLTVFSRAERWGAILLLDESDVYIRKRGDDLNQNAIVGVFLRVLEYYNGVLFMTTNRPDTIDDAIASRCIARIVYEAPTVKDAERIWQVLADTQGLNIKPAIIKQLSKKYEGITGRDIKNILKLVSLISGKEKTITVEAVDFAYRFKPTE